MDIGRSKCSPKSARRSAGCAERRGHAAPAAPTCCACAGAPPARPPALLLSSHTPAAARPVPNEQSYGLAFMRVPWPAAAKAAVVAPLAIVSSWIAATIIKAIPGVSRVL